MPAPFVYERRKPEQTTLYAVVRDNVETLYAATSESGSELPGCARSGFCPSCMGRRMAQTAANLVESVLPSEVALRQWVLTVHK